MVHLSSTTVLPQKSSDSPTDSVGRPMLERLAMMLVATTQGGRFKWARDNHGATQPLGQGDRKIRVPRAHVITEVVERSKLVEIVHGRNSFSAHDLNCEDSRFDCLE